MTDSLEKQLRTSNCEVTAKKPVEVCVEVKVTPSAEINGGVTSECCGQPDVSNEPCTGETSCTFYLRQSICVTIPVTIGASAEVKNKTIECNATCTTPCQ